MKTSMMRSNQRMDHMRDLSRAFRSRQGVVFSRLLDLMIEIFGEQLAEMRDELAIIESKFDSHVSTLRSDISQVRQAIKEMHHGKSDDA